MYFYPGGDVSGRQAYSIFIYAKALYPSKFSPKSTIGFSLAPNCEKTLGV